MSDRALRPEASLERLQAQLGHHFRDTQLLRQALTHRSFGAQHNERLEFLGDAVLALAISHMLLQRFVGSDEGDLTRVRAHLVKEASLHQVALQLNIPAHLRMSEGEARSGGAQRPSMLADAVEALLGAVHQDAGFEAALAVVQGLFGPQIRQTEMQAWTKDAKTDLQERLQARRLKVPSYRIVSTRGQAHEQTFEVACEVSELSLSTQAEGRSRRTAEQEAARKMLALLASRTAHE